MKKAVVLVIAALLAITLVSCSYPTEVTGYTVDGEYIPIKLGKLIITEEIEPPESVEDPEFYYIEYYTLKGLDHDVWLAKKTLETIFDNEGCEAMTLTSATENPAAEWNIKELFVYSSADYTGDTSNLYTFSGEKPVDAGLADELQADLTAAQETYMSLDELIATDSTGSNVPYEVCSVGARFTKTDSVVWNAAVIYYNGYYYRIAQGADYKYAPMNEQVSAAVTAAFGFSPAN